MHHRGTEDTEKSEKGEARKPWERPTENRSFIHRLPRLSQIENERRTTRDKRRPPAQPPGRNLRKSAKSADNSLTRRPAASARFTLHERRFTHPRRPAARQIENSTFPGPCLSPIARCTIRLLAVLSIGLARIEMRRHGFTRSDTDSMPLFRRAREPGLGTRDTSYAWTPAPEKIEGRCEFPLAAGGHPEHGQGQRAL
jgi:hypothetical protein